MVNSLVATQHEPEEDDYILIDRVEEVVYLQSVTSNEDLCVHQVIIIKIHKNVTATKEHEQNISISD